MKKIITILFSIFFYSHSFALNINYYVSSAGNDGNSGLIGFPWKTIAKVNTVLFGAGDHILFNRGDQWHETIIVTRSGVVGNPIVYSAYGSGANPLITGFVTAATWVNLGSNIWESNAIAGGLAYTNMVVINGVNSVMGRTPNTGTYYTAQTHSGSPTNTITSTNLNAGVINYSGAEVVIRIASYRIARNVIVSQSGTSLTFTPDTDPAGQGFQGNNNQFIIQNDTRTLDVQNEWYYVPSTKKVRVFSGAMPVNVQVPTLDSLVVLTGRSYVTFDGLSFKGANKELVQNNHSPNITFQNCDFQYSGRDGIYMTKTGNGNNMTISNCTITDINNNGIDIPKADGDFATITGNTIKKCGLIFGEIDRNDGMNGNNTAQACSAAGASTLMQLNRVDSMGFMGLRFYGSNTTVQKNYVTNFCFLLNDGGGIYTWNGASKTVQSGIQILDNIVINNNTTQGVNGADYGIYIDDLSNNITVRGNTCASASWGLEIHNAFNITEDSNTTYNNGMASIILIQDSAISPYVAGHASMDNLTLTHNIWFARTAGQMTLWDYKTNMPISGLIPSAFVSDFNYFARPIDNNGQSTTTVYQAPSDPPFISTNRNLAQWQSYSGHDLSSGTTPTGILSLSQLDFEFNPTNAVVAEPIPAGIWQDVRGTTYSGTITLQPYRSAVLIQSGSNVSPLANAGADQSITLPTSSATVSGSGSDVDGTIASYLWTQTAGAAATITSATSATTTITGLAAGSYTFLLTVTDNLGATGTDAVNITVNTAGTLQNFIITKDGKIYRPIL